MCLWCVSRYNSVWFGVERKGGREQFVAIPVVVLPLLTWTFFSTVLRLCDAYVQCRSPKAILFLYNVNKM